MTASRALINQANAITSKYNGYIASKQLQNMYDELIAIGITVGLISSDSRKCEWYFNGKEIENSMFIYSVYEGERLNDYTIYFS